MRRPPGVSATRSAVERITLAVSFLVIGALLAVALISESRRDPGDGGNLEVVFDMEGASFRDDAHFIPYTIRNSGSEAIAAAEIWFDTYAGEQLIESARVTVQFLPLDGTQNGIFVTTHDPDTHIFLGRLETLQFP
jgi:uncharacterized protein (TIGR02588 family)